MATKERSGEDEEKQEVATQDHDARTVVSYLVVPESSQYIAIMDTLEGSITDLTSGEVGVRLQAAGILLDANLVQMRPRSAARRPLASSAGSLRTLVQGLGRRASARTTAEAW
jgi:hypothetical protein